MKHLASSLAAAWLALGTSLTADPAQAAAVGTTFGKPHILGKVVPGEFEEAQKDLSGHFDQPMSLKIDPASHPVEVMRIGLWLREQKPMLRVKGSCVGSCAWFVLDSARTLDIDPGAVIALSMMPELWAMLREQLDRGDLTIDDDRSRASIAGFIGKIPAQLWERSQLLRETRLKQASAPAWVQSFVEAATHIQITQLVHDERDFKIAMQLSPQKCLWWVPDVEGLRQLGLSPTRYVPVTAAEAARALEVDPKTIYVGPALQVMPDRPLCEGPSKYMELPRFLVR